MKMNIKIMTQLLEISLIMASGTAHDPEILRRSLYEGSLCNKMVPRW